VMNQGGPQVGLARAAFVALSQAVLRHLPDPLRRSEPLSGLAVLVRRVDAACGVEALAYVGHALSGVAQLVEQLVVHDGLADNVQLVPGPLWPCPL
jgi:hypothetical protein